MAARFLLIISILGLLATRSFAAPTLKEATEPFRKNSTFEAQLKISFNSEVSSKEHRIATLTVSGDMFSLQLTDQHIFCDGENSYTYMPSEKEIVIEERDTRSPLYSPRSLLSLDSTLFSVSKVESRSDTDIYTLQNSRETMGVSSILVYVTNGTLKRILIIDNGGDEIDIEILSVDFNVKPNIKLFTFDKKDYSGVEVIDFRN